MNKKLIKFTIITPRGSEIMEVEWLEVHTNSGSFIVQPGRAPIIVALSAKKELTMGLENGAKKIVTVTEGILEVNRNYATLLLTHD